MLVAQTDFYRMKNVWFMFCGALLKITMGDFEDSIDLKSINRPFCVN